MSNFNVIYKYSGSEALSGVFKTDAFSSNADAIRISVSGESDGEMCITVFGIDNSGREGQVFSRSFARGRFGMEESFDPISLAVYSGAVSFLIKLESRGRYSVDELIAEEEIAEGDIRDESADLVKVKGVIPSRVLFVGNSLVFGMGKRYGMCASAPDKDYYHYVTEYIKKYNPVCRFDKLYGSMFEHSESVEAFDRWYDVDCEVDPALPHPAKGSFCADNDIIFLQMGDNINTDAKLANFLACGDLLIGKIKSASPKARIIWIHGWYNRARTVEPIKALCERWGIERLDIGAIRSQRTEAHSQKYYFDVNEGREKEVSERWITHPGDLGMKMIAERIIEKLNFDKI